MNLKKNVFVLSALLLATTATAQMRGNQVTQRRGTTYNGAIGNSYLGGTVNAHALLTTTSGYLGNQVGLNIGGSAAVNLLSHSSTLALVSAVCNNGAMLGSPPVHAGNFHVQIIGFDLINRTFQTDTTFARQTWNFNVFGPNGVSASIPVGPVSVTLRGNVGAGLTISTSFVLAAPTTINAGGYAQAFGTADASVGIGIPYFSLGVGINGHILQQDLTMLCGCSVSSGIYGVVSYSLQPIALTLYAYAQAIYRWTTNLTSWSSPSVTRNLL